ncbi:MAG: hypothetical protein AB7H90_21820 [Alphaproteobacteria bacterium]
MADPLQGISADQRRELAVILQRLARLWADLTEAAAAQDRDRAEAIRQEIAQYRQRVGAIKRAGTIGSA